MTKRLNRPNRKGRSTYTGGQFLALGYPMLKHPNFRALSGASLKVLVELGTKHNGSNNGRIAMSYDELAQTPGIGKTTGMRACQDLEYYGFIKLKKAGRFIGRQASEWEITFCSSEGYNPTNDWKKEKPPLRPRPKKQKTASIVDEIYDGPEYAESRNRKISSRYQNET